MPGTYTYPGVYVEEIPSGVHPIMGVSTAETAFVDFFARGPVDSPVRVTSLGDFGRAFGGVDNRSEASYAIQQYYLNGGRTAWVVRVGVGAPATAARTLTGGSPPQNTLTVRAANPGTWGNRLRVAVIQGGTAGRFDVFVREVVTTDGQDQVVDSETYRNLSMSKTDSRYGVDVVNAASALVRLADVGAGESPTAVPANASGGADDSAFQALTGGTDGTAFDAAGALTTAGASALANQIRGLNDDGSAKTTKGGMLALDRIEPFIFNIMCLPATAKMADATARAVLAAAETYCEGKRAFLIADIPQTVATQAAMTQWMSDNGVLRHKNAAVYFPRLEISDPLNEGRARNVGASGTMAGVYARTDATLGVWKSPAGTDAVLRGAALTVTLGDQENGALNPLGINVLRNFAVFGNVSWGARTLDGADQKASEWKYIAVRRTALFLEESLFQGLKWVVFEPNDEPLWSQIRLNVGAFMQGLFRQGAFQGKTPRDAYVVKCDSETTTQADIDRGIVNILVGFAPLKPAEFVVIKIQQKAGQTEG